jgi:hypothetical protein
MCRKSHAMRPSACAVRNSRHVGPLRRGAGSTPAAVRISQTVVVPIGMSEAGEFALDPSTAPTRILLGQPQHQRLHRAGGRWPAWPPAALAVVPFDRDEPAVPREQGRGRDREHPRPSASREQRGQRSEPDPVQRLVPHRTGELPAQHRVLMPQHQQLGILGRASTQQHRQDRQQLPRNPIHQ